MDMCGIPEKSLVLAPMAGLATPEFRKYLADLSLVRTEWTPFIRVTRDAHPARAIKRELERCPDNLVSVLQLMGTEPESLGLAAQCAEELEIKRIDLNAGCPVRKITAKGAGAALLRDMPLLLRIISSMRRRFRGFLSVKVRAGYDEVLDIESLVCQIADAGADCIVIHARLAASMYGGCIDQDIIARAVGASAVPIVGNGEIVNYGDAVKMLENTGCYCIMAGRGMIRNPWLAVQLEQSLQKRPVTGVSGALLAEYLLAMAEAYAASGIHGEKLRSRLVAHAKLCGTMLNDNGSWSYRACRTGNMEEMFELIDEMKAFSEDLTRRL